MPGTRLTNSFSLRLVDLAQSRAGVVLATYLALAAIGFWYTVNNLGINTNTEDMIAKELPWRQTFIEYHEAFPQFVGNLLVIIDGLTPELARSAQYRLAAAMDDQPELFGPIHSLGSGDFLDRHGLLFLDEEDLVDLSDNLVNLQPILGILARDSSLAGLADVFSLIRRAPDDTEFLELGNPLGNFTDAFDRSTQNIYAPLSWQNLLANQNSGKSANRRVILLKPNRDFEQFLPGEAAVEAIRELARNLDLIPERGISIRMTGPVALEHEELQSIQQGAVLAGLLALLMVSLVLIYALRSWQLIAASLITLLTGLIGTAAFAAVAVGHLNLISIAFAVLYIGLGIDFAVHFSLRYRELISQQHHQVAALRETASDVGGSLVICTLTTSVGFFSFYPTDFVGVSELGLISGCGMFISLLVSLTLLPALLKIWPLKAPVKPPVLGVLRDLTANPKYTTYIRVAGILFALLALTQVSQLAFDVNPVSLRDPSAESVVTFKEMLRDEDATPMTLSILEPDLQSAINTAEKLEQISEVRKTLTIADLIPDRQAEKLEVLDELSVLLGPTLSDIKVREAPADPESSLIAIDRLAESLAALENHVSGRNSDALRKLLDSVRKFRVRIEAAGENEKQQLLQLLEANLLGGLSPTLQLLDAAITADEFDIDGLPDDLKAQWLTRDNRYRVAIYPQSDLATLDAEARFVSAVLEEAPEATGVPVVGVMAGEAVVAAFQQALATAILLVFILLVLVTRNLRDPLLIVTPVLLAALLTAAVTVLLDIPLNFANIIALPLLFGMGVDNGIHIVHRYRVTHSGAAKLMATSTAAAVFFGTLTTVFSFGNLAMSPHVGMASMGQLLTIGMLLTMVTTLIFLPAMLTGRRGQ